MTTGAGSTRGGSTGHEPPREDPAAGGHTPLRPVPPPPTGDVAQAILAFQEAQANLERIAGWFEQEHYTGWARHMRQDAELAGYRARNIAEGHGVEGELHNVRAVIAEEKQAGTSDTRIDSTDLRWLEDVLAHLEELHDIDAVQMPGHTPGIRGCLCGASSAFAHARQVTTRLRLALGLRERLTDRV